MTWLTLDDDVVIIDTDTYYKRIIFSSLFSVGSDTSHILRISSLSAANPNVVSVTYMIADTTPFGVLPMSRMFRSLSRHAWINF